MWPMWPSSSFWYIALRYQVDPGCHVVITAICLPNLFIFPKRKSVPMNGNPTCPFLSSSPQPLLNYGLRPHGHVIKCVVAERFDHSKSFLNVQLPKANSKSKASWFWAIWLSIPMSCLVGLHCSLSCAKVHAHVHINTLHYACHPCYRTLMNSAWYSSTQIWN